MQGRRAYKDGADVALKKSSLGVKRRVDGMARIFERAGKGLDYKSPQIQKKEEDTDSCTNSDEEEEEPEDEKPFEPLRVWQSPHQGSAPKGLPSQL